MVIYTSNDIHPKGRGLGIDRSLPSHRRRLGQEFDGWLESRLAACSLRSVLIIDAGSRLRSKPFFSCSLTLRLREITR